MMPGFRSGAKRGVRFVLLGFLLAVIGGTLLPYVRATGLVPWWVYPGVTVVAVGSLSWTVKASKYWSYRYLGGFVGAILVVLPFLLQTAFLGLRELLLYGGVAVAVILFRMRVGR